MSEQLLDLLKLCLLALIYLFFLRVIWAVWAEMARPAPQPAGPAVPNGSKTKPRSAAPASRRGRRGRSLPRSLVVVEPVAMAGTEYPMAEEMTLGRSPGCSIVVDDTYVSQVHARIFAAGETFQVEDLGSTNGTMRNGSKLVAVEALKAGDRLRIGSLVLEAR